MVGAVRARAGARRGARTRTAAEVAAATRVVALAWKAGGHTVVRMSHAASGVIAGASGDEAAAFPVRAAPDVQCACGSLACSPALACGAAHAASHHARPVEAVETSRTSTRAVTRSTEDQYNVDGRDRASGGGVPWQPAGDHATNDPRMS